MAGETSASTTNALGAVRVMRTCGMMGEIVGMAASICREHDCLPRDVYEHHLNQLQTLMHRGAGKENTQQRSRTKSMQNGNR